MSTGMRPSTEPCSKCKGHTYLIEAQGDWAHAKVCSCSEKCEMCGGSGHRYATTEATFSSKVGKKKYEVLAPCMCTLRRQRIARFNKAGIPGIIDHAGFRNYEIKHPAQGEAYNVVRNFIAGFKKSGWNKGFMLSGPVGTGKTHLLAATLAHLILEEGVEARYIEISLLYATIRRGFQEGKSGGEIIGPLAEVPVLAIDELGKGRGNAFEMDTMDELISRRYNAERTTLFATNYSLKPEDTGPVNAPQGYKSTQDLKDASQESQLLLRRVGERIYSRLHEMCTMVELPRGVPDKRRGWPEAEPPQVQPRPPTLNTRR